MNLTPDSSFESLLGQLNPIKNLPNRLERQLLKKAQVVELDKRDRLDAYTENRWILYLLEGTLRVSSEHHEPETITPPSPRSLRPIFDSHTIKGVALSMTRSRVIKVDRQLYELLLREQDEDGIEIRDVQINQEEGALFQSLYRAYSLQKLELPTMPEVAFAIRKAMEDDGVSTQDIARIIQMDPVVSGGVMKAANSALYRGTHKITSIKDAIVRIGLNATRDLAISLAMQNVFKARHPDTKKVMHEEWERCVHVSALSYAIARHVRHLSPETAMLAGLLHRIGAIPILTHIDTHDLEFDDHSLKAAINKLHPLVGVLLGDILGMPNRGAQHNCLSNKLPAGHHVKQVQRNLVSIVIPNNVATRIKLVVFIRPVPPNNSAHRDGHINLWQTLFCWRNKEIHTIVSSFATWCVEMALPGRVVAYSVTCWRYHFGIPPSNRKAV